MKIIYFIALLLSCNTSSFGKNDSDSIKQHELPQRWEEVEVKEISGPEILQSIKNNPYELNWIIIYTEGCSGTSGMLDYLMEMKNRHGDKINVYLLASEYKKRISTIKKLIFDKKITVQPYIIADGYGKYWDNRKIGKKLSEEICVDCKSDPIGSPYNIVFDKELKIVFHGYRVYKNSRSEDIISELIDNMNE